MKVLEFQNRVIRLLQKCSWLPPLLTRITLGGVFIESGWGKLTHIPKVVEFFTSLGLPAPEFQAHLVAFTEFSCGIFLLFGFLTRLASIPLTVVMTMALLTAKSSDIQRVTDLFAISEYLYSVMFIGLMISGGGLISVDSLISQKRRRTNSN